MNVPKCCKDCKWWKTLPNGMYRGAIDNFACHCYLETGIRHGRTGDACTTWEPRTKRKER